MMDDPRSRTIFKACEQGSLAELKKVIAAGQEVDAKNMTGYRSTHLAAKNGHAECLEYLLDLPGVDPNWMSFQDETPLMLASIPGHTECLHILLKKRADPNICNYMMESPLLKAVQNGHLCGVELLLRNGADPNKGQFSGCTPLHSAVYGQNLTLLKVLLENGADVGRTEECNLTPIFIASQFGFLDCLSVLVEEAEKQNQKDLVNMSAEDGATPLYLAAQNGHVECVDLLLRAGADPDKVANCPRAVALYAAIQFNRIECVQLLLPKTDCKVYASCDATPFEIAASIGDRNSSGEILQYLVDNIQNYHIDTLHYMDLDSFVYRLFPSAYYRVNSMTATSLTSMIISGCHPGLISIMLKAGALPDCSKSIASARMLNAGATPDSFPVRHLLSNTLPPIIADCENDKTEILELLLKHGANPNIYSPTVEYNLSILFSLLSSKKLGLLLRSGVETTSCFHSLNHSSVTSREQYSGFFSSKSTFGDTYVIPESFTKVLQHFREFYSQVTRLMRIDVLIKLLLEFTTSPGYRSDIVDLVNPGTDKNDIVQIMSNPSSLVHSCRVKIRECLTFRNLRREILVSLLNLPTVVCDFILYAGDFDTVTDLVNAEPRLDAFM
ncbi:ankyrin-3-like [Lineus longissimus]|uniref:ankyrin-3-like n=1 Tax=Lineus longissimus TaxID=88925 RepID=UPI00315D874E